MRQLYIPEDIYMVTQEPEGFYELVASKVREGMSWSMAFDLSVQKIKAYFPEWKVHSCYNSWYLVRQRKLKQSKEIHTR